jgi:hypothetical protein
MLTDVSEVRAASIIRAMMEAARISETSIDIQLKTRQYIPEDSELHTRRSENLKSDMYCNFSISVCISTTLLTVLYLLYAGVMSATFLTIPYLVSVGTYLSHLYIVRYLFYS